MNKMIENLKTAFNVNSFGGPTIGLMAFNGAMFVFVFVLAGSAITIVKGRELTYDTLLLLSLLMYADSFIALAFKHISFTTCLILLPITTGFLAVAYLLYGLDVIPALFFIILLMIYTLFGSIIGTIRGAKLNRIVSKRLKGRQLENRNHAVMVWTSISGILAVFFGLFLSSIIDKDVLPESIISISGVCFMIIFFFEIYLSTRIKDYVLRRKK